MARQALSWSTDILNVAPSIPMHTLKLAIPGFLRILSSVLCQLFPHFEELIVFKSALLPGDRTDLVCDVQCSTCPSLQPNGTSRAGLCRAQIYWHTAMLFENVLELMLSSVMKLRSIAPPRSIAALLLKSHETTFRTVLRPRLLLPDM